MLTFDSLPQARVARIKGQLVAPPPRPPEPRTRLAESLYNVAAIALGLWPLTAVMVLGFAMLALAGLYTSP
ncbi:MAG: hypothetical protein H0T42_11990 [Deltaproteobacteria bacterium]|nr:hypothetical protein [Deltaproteobacteria bacterium]